MRNLFLFVIFFAIYSQSHGQQEFTLDQAIAYAEEHNMTLKAKKLDVQDADQDIKNVLSGALPQVNAGVDYQYYFNVPAQPIADFITPSVYGVLFQENVIPIRDLGPPAISTISFFQPHNLTGKLDVSMLVYDGAYRYGVKGAKLIKELTQKQIDATAYTTKTNVTKAYLNCLITAENIQILDNNIKILTKSLNDTKAMYEAGFVESLDVDRLQLSYDNLTSQKTNLNELIKLTKNLLKFQMGFPMEEDIVLAEDLEKMVNEMKIEAGIAPDIDYNKRPEFAVIEMGEQLNELDYLRNKASYLPSVRAFASAQGSLQRSNLFDNDEAGWIPTSLAGLAINIPIYDGGSKKANIAKTRIAADRITLQKEEFKSAVSMQVNNATISINNASNTLENRKRALEMNESIYKRVNVKFVEGVGSSIEVSQAEASLFEAQANYINALYDLISAKSDLDIALGNI